MIVVTGTGIVSAIGTNTPEVARALLADTSGIAPVRFLETQHRQITRMLGLAPTYLIAAKPKPRAWLAPHTLHTAEAV